MIYEILSSIEQVEMKIIDLFEDNSNLLTGLVLGSRSILQQLEIRDSCKNKK